MDDVTETLERAVICDIDGTLALRDESKPGCRRFYDWHRVGEDLPNEPVVELVRIIHANGQHRIIVMSGRDEVCRVETEKWLTRHDIPYHELHMRSFKDNRKDAVVKRELYDEFVAGRHRVSLVLDDRDTVVSLWRRDLGLPCFQVAYGDF